MARSVGDNNTIFALCVGRDWVPLVIQIRVADRLLLFPEEGSRSCIYSYMARKRRFLEHFSFANHTHPGMHIRSWKMILSPGFASSSGGLRKRKRNLVSQQNNETSRLTHVHQGQSLGLIFHLLPSSTSIAKERWYSNYTFYKTCVALSLPLTFLL